jgi:hypothetical protein
MSKIWTNQGTQFLADGGELIDAMKANHRRGLPWTDPRTGRTHTPPKRRKPKVAQKRAKGRKRR